MSEECSKEEYDNVSDADVPQGYRYNRLRAIKRLFGKPKIAEPVEEKMEALSDMIDDKTTDQGEVPDYIVRVSTGTTDLKCKNTLREKIMERKRRLIE